MLLLTTGVLFSVGRLSPVLVAAQSAKQAVCEGAGLAGASCAPPAGTPTIDTTIASVINVLSIIVGVAAVIIIIVAGLKYVLSSGDSAKVNSAKDTILFAVVGLIIVALAQVIVRFVLSKV